MCLRILKKLPRCFSGLVRLNSFNQIHFGNGFWFTKLLSDWFLEKNWRLANHCMQWNIRICWLAELLCCLANFLHKTILIFICYIQTSFSYLHLLCDDKVDISQRIILRPDLALSIVSQLWPLLQSVMISRGILFKKFDPRSNAIIVIWCHMIRFMTDALKWRLE